MSPGKTRNPGRRRRRSLGGAKLERGDLVHESYWGEQTRVSRKQRQSVGYQSSCDPPGESLLVLKGQINLNTWKITKVRRALGV